MTYPEASGHRRNGPDQRMVDPHNCTLVGSTEKRKGRWIREVDIRTVYTHGTHVTNKLTLGLGGTRRGDGALITVVLWRWFEGVGVGSAFE